MYFSVITYLSFGYIYNAVMLLIVYSSLLFTFLTLSYSQWNVSLPFNKVSGILPFYSFFVPFVYSKFFLSFVYSQLISALFLQSLYLPYFYIQFISALCLCPFFPALCLLAVYFYSMFIGPTSFVREVKARSQCLEDVVTSPCGRIRQRVGRCER